MNVLLKDPGSTKWQLENPGKPLEPRPFTPLSEEELEKVLTVVVRELWKPLDTSSDKVS